MVFTSGHASSAKITRHFSVGVGFVIPSIAEWSSPTLGPAMSPDAGQCGVCKKRYKNFPKHWREACGATVEQKTCSACDQIFTSTAQRRRHEDTKTHKLRCQLLEAVSATEGVAVPAPIAAPAPVAKAIAAPGPVAIAAPAPVAKAIAAPAPVVKAIAAPTQAPDARDTALLFGGVGDQSILAAGFPNFATLSTGAQADAFEAWLSGSDPAAACTSYCGNMKKRGARGYRGYVFRMATTHLDTLKLSPTGGLVERLEVLRRLSDGPLLFPDMTHLAHPLRLSLLLHGTEFFTASSTLTSRCMALLKFFEFLSFLYAPAGGSTFARDIDQASKVLMQCKRAGSQWQKQRKIATEVVAATSPPLIRNMPKFATSLFAGMTGVLDSCISQAGRPGVNSVLGTVFNKG
jgi:hypothetical protein